MTTWQWLSLMVIALVHTAALFRWAGRIDILVASLVKDVTDLRKAKHDHADFLNRHEAEIYLLKDNVRELQIDVKEARQREKPA